MDVSNTTRIVVLGKTGAGKSSLANTIFGEKDLFKIGHTVNSDTAKCRAETKSVNGRSFTLIDTPGFFDTVKSEEMKPEILKCIIECTPGPHVFLIVLKVEKFTEHEQAIITEIKQYFSEECFKYATVLFTHGDQLNEGQTIEGFLHDHTIMSDLMEKCGGRCHVIDNKYWKNNQPDEYRNNQFQVKRLLKTIHMMIEANKGSCYTNEMLQTVEDEIQQEVEVIRQSSGNMSEKEIREQAKDNVSQRLLIKLAGITTGALLGTLCGVVLVAGRVVETIKKPQSEPGQSLNKIAAFTTVGETAVAITAGAVGTSIIGAAYSAAGAVKGALTGYDAAEGVNTPLEAVKRAAEAVKKETMSALEALGIKTKDKTESKP